MTRFFVDSLDPAAGILTLTGENAAHARVLRLRPGELVTVCDGAGTEVCCAVERVEAGCVALRPGQTALSSAEPAAEVTVYMAFAKSDKLEHVIQKATELGAAQIVAYPTARCVSRPDAKSLPKKLERWQKIAASAAAQCGRGRIPAVRAVGSYAAALAEAAEADLAVLFYENERSRTFRGAVEAGPFRTAALLTGPEGGYEPEEVARAEQAGLQICTLGRRILRCETAPLCALSALMYASGEF